MLQNRFRLARGLSLSFFVLVAAVAAGGCGGLDTPNVPPSTRPSFGELVYRILKSRMEASATCSTEYLSALESNHADFVTTFDYVMENGVTDDFPDLLGGTIKPFVDNDALPRLVDTMAATLALLVSDEFDPNRETIQAMVNLSEAQTLLESSIAIQLVATILEDPTITDKIHTLATIAQENDGVTYLMDDLFDVASYALTSDPTPSTCTGIETPDAQSTLLRTDGFVENPALALGSPFYLARPDLHGNPQAAFYDGAIIPPFVDADADGAADIDADGNPIDANGAVIDIPMIGEDGAVGRDEFGRAIDAQGRFYYVYYDVKRTALSYTTQLGADLFATGVHHQLPGVVNAVLGEPVVCADGENCRVYPTETNVVGDLVWLLLELFKYERTSVFMHTLTDGFTTDPVTAERFLIAIGDAIRALDQSSLAVTDSSIPRAVAGMVPIIHQILSTPNTSGKSTARLIVELFEMLGAEADMLPQNLAYLLTHQADPDAQGGVESVNLSAPRYNNGDDNRTGLEQIVEMFDYADCGYIGTGGNLLQGLVYNVFNAMNPPGAPNLAPGTVAEVLVQLVGQMQPGGVGNIVTLLTNVRALVGSGLLSVVFGPNAVGASHGAQYPACSSARSTALVNHLNSLEILVQSSALDWLLPMANVFVSQGQRRTFVDIYVYMAQDLRQDETVAPGTSGFRKLGPILLELTKPSDPNDATSTPFNRIWDAVEILNTIPASDGSGSSLDVLFDALTFMTTNGTVSTRPLHGTPTSVPNSSVLAELLETFAVLQERVAAGNAAPNLSALLDGITPMLTETTGSGVDRHLANPNLRALIAATTEIMADATALPTDAYLCYILDLQTTSAEFFDTKHFATLVRILNHLVSSPNAAGLEDWILSMLRGNPDRSLELYGRLCQLIAGGLSSNASSDDLSQILDWLGASLNASGAGGMREMVQTLDQLLAADTNGSILVMMRSLLAPGPLPTMERPVTTYLDMASDIAAVDPDNMCMATGAELDPADVEDMIQGVSDFLARDPNDNRQTGIEQIWQLVGQLAPEE